MTRKRMSRRRTAPFLLKPDRMAKLPAAWRALKAAALPPPKSAKLAGLRYVDDRRVAGIRRRGTKTRVRYVAPGGRTIVDAAEIQRIRALVIPPAWTDVWICPDPRGHLQATGRDARGRKQYRYHREWRACRDETKFDRLPAFASALPALRARIDADLRRPRLPPEKVHGAV